MNVFIQIKDDNGNIYEGTAILTKQKQASSKPKSISTTKKTPSNVLQQIYQDNFFIDNKTLNDVYKKFKELGFNFGRSSVYMALESSNYLKRSGSKGKYRFIQKYPMS